MSGIVEAVQICIVNI